MGAKKNFHFLPTGAAPARLVLHLLGNPPRSLASRRRRGLHGDVRLLSLMSHVNGLERVLGRYLFDVREAEVRHEMGDERRVVRGRIHVTPFDTAFIALAQRVLDGADGLARREAHELVIRVLSLMS